MKRLSDQAVITIVSALLRRREDALQLQTHYFEEKSRQANQHAGAADCLKYTQESLERNGVALCELSEEVAPWIKDFPELNSLFEQALVTTTSTEDPQLPSGSVMEMAELTKNGVTE